MATQSTSLAWEIPWTEKPGGLQSMEQESDMTEWLNKQKQIPHQPGQSCQSLAVMKVRGTLSELQFTNMGAKLGCYWDGHEGDTIPEATVQVTTLKGGAWY